MYAKSLICPKGPHHFQNTLKKKNVSAFLLPVMELMLIEITASLCFFSPAVYGFLSWFHLTLPTYTMTTCGFLAKETRSISMVFGTWMELVRSTTATLKV